MELDTNHSDIKYSVLSDMLKHYLNGRHNVSMQITKICWIYNISWRIFMSL